MERKDIEVWGKTKQRKKRKYEVEFESERVREIK